MTTHSMRGTSEPLDRKDILGVAVASLTADQAAVLLKRRLAERRFTRVSFLNAHNANVAASDPRVAAMFSEFLVLPDGVGVDIAARLLYGSPFPANLNGTDFIPALLRSARFPLKVALLGARRENVERAASRLAEIAPQHSVEVIHDGFFDERGGGGDPRPAGGAASRRPLGRHGRATAGAVDRRQAPFRPLHHADRRRRPVRFPQRFHPAGAGPASRLRLEWLFRLALEPGRLWRRYLIGNPLFLWRVLRQRSEMTRRR